MSPPSQLPERVRVVDHPVLGDRLARLRDRGTDNSTFRRLVGELSTFLAYEALRDLATADGTVDTPVTKGAPARRVTETVLLVPVLRAGLGMVPAIQEVLPLSEVAHVGLRRDETTLRPEVYLDKLPADLAGRRVVICDPMLATGGSLLAVCDLAVRRGATDLAALCLIASLPGVRAFADRFAQVPVTCAAVDPQLNERGFIVPGLGDAGDRQFGPPA